MVSGPSARRPTTTRILIASVGTIVVTCCIFILTYATRPLPALDLLFFLVLMPIAIIGWSALVLRLLWRRQWSAAVCGLPFLAFVALAITWPAAVGEQMIGVVRQIEFLKMRASYEAKVAAMPKGGIPRLVKVSYRDTSVWCCSTQTFEEIWFDESDALGSPDRAITDRVFWQSHPSYLGHSSYSIRSLGEHYYFVDSWY